MLFTNVGVRIEIILINDIFGNGGEGILIGLHFFLLDIIVVFIVFIILIIEIGTRGVVTETFVMASALVVVSIGKLEVDRATGNNSRFFWKGRDS